jgi:hypothetical protein
LFFQEMKKPIARVKKIGYRLALRGKNRGPGLMLAPLGE